MTPRLVSGLRLLVAALITYAVVVTYVFSWQSRGAMPNFFNFFGFFTIQSNLLALVALVIAAMALARGRSLPEWFHLARGAITAYIAVVGVVYVIVLAPAGAEGGVSAPISNFILHYLTPLYLPLDWLLFNDRPALSWRRLWWVLSYPLVWVCVVLLRGANDGWVPYPFLDPATGYGSISVYCAAILLIGLGFGALAWWASRARTPWPLTTRAGVQEIPARRP